MKNYASRLKILGHNHAERAALKLRIASICLAVAGFLVLSFGLSIENLMLPFIGGVYFSAISAACSIICFIGSVSTYSNNALFRDRDEMLSAIRVIEAEKRSRDLNPMQDGT